MGENAAGPVEVNTYYCSSVDCELEPCIQKGYFFFANSLELVHFGED